METARSRLGSENGSRKVRKFSLSEECLVEERLARLEVERREGVRKRRRSIVEGSGATSRERCWEAAADENQRETRDVRPARWDAFAHLGIFGRGKFSALVRLDNSESGIYARSLEGRPSSHRLNDERHGTHPWSSPQQLDQPAEASISLAPTSLKESAAARNSFPSPTHKDSNIPALSTPTMATLSYSRERHRQEHAPEESGEGALKTLNAGLYNSIRTRQPIGPFDAVCGANRNVAPRPGRRRREWLSERVKLDDHHASAIEHVRWRELSPWTLPPR
mmetsp:Transcript_17462/g.36252  ORF Transcript_17462/g.36252 Transcript_17462/m.36252 type:complete len:279 (-) Transcript_17462:262-1098(-)